MKIKGKWTKKVQLFKYLDEKWLFEIFQNVLIKEFMEEWNTHWVDAWIRVKQLIASNVSLENALWNGVLEMEE
jgi:hypothetical protein